MTVMVIMVMAVVVVVVVLVGVITMQIFSSVLQIIFLWFLYIVTGSSLKPVCSKKFYVFWTKWRYKQTEEEEIHKGSWNVHLTV
jgi:cell division protein FtsW (lipid II flippase)